MVIVSSVGLGHAAGRLDGWRLRARCGCGLRVELGCAEWVPGRHAEDQVQCMVLCTQKKPRSSGEDVLPRREYCC